MIRRRNRGQPGVRDVVTSVEQQSAEAAALARIAGQARLLDPRMNPATRGHADRLRNDQQLRTLNAEHTRLVRRIRVEDGRAADAEEALEAIQLARQASSPARSVWALHINKRRYMRLSLGASLVLAAGSAMGVEAAAQFLKDVFDIQVPPGSGYIAEIGLTGLSTVAISYRAHLAEHGGRLTRAVRLQDGSIGEEPLWQSKVLWTLMIAPLSGSVACNLATLNVVGALCAIGAAAFALLGCVVADRSADAMQARAADVDDEDEKELRSVAKGDDLFTAVTDQEQTSDGQSAEDTDGEIGESDRLVSGDDRSVTEQPAEEPETTAESRLGDEIEAEIRAWLDQDPPDAGRLISSPPEPDSDAPHGAARDLFDSDGEQAHIGAHEVSQIENEQDGRRLTEAAHFEAHIDSGEVSHIGPHIDGLSSATEARRQLGELTRSEIKAQYLKDPNQTVGQIAEAVGKSRATVNRYLPDIKRDLEDNPDQ